jgi:anaerobic magnesium-protoporphyrin IX monomethyl ester cyclase
MDRKEVILIQPPIPKSLQKEYISVQVPTNLGYIASALISAGARVTIIDFVVERYKRGIFLKELYKNNPVLVGFTSVTSSLPFVDLISKHIKIFNPEIPTVLGGIHASALPFETLDQLKYIDFIVVGEGENTIRELYREILGNQNYCSVNGIVFKNMATGEFCMTPKRKLISDLDTIDFPPRELFEIKKYQRAHVSRGFSRKGLSIMELITSRGCTQDCIFCAGHINYGKILRFRNKDNIIKEIELNISARKVDHISIEDDAFTLNKNLVIELGKYLKSKNITWNCNSTIGAVNQDIALNMAQNNCRKVSFGIESGSDRILKLSKKNITVSQIMNTFRIFRKARMRYIEGNFMLGSHPDEMIEDIKMTEKLIFMLKPDFITLTIMCPFPGTESYEIMEKENLLPKHKNWLNFNLVTKKLTYKKLYHLSSEELLYWRNYLLKKYYTSSYIFRQIFSIRNLNELGYLLNLAKSIYRDRIK